jgi:hypothetical protein
MQISLLSKLQLKEEFEDTEGVIRIRISNRDENGKEKMLTNQYLCQEEPMDC